MMHFQFQTYVQKIPNLRLKSFKILIWNRIIILADSLPEYASSNFAISSKSTESSSDTFLRFKSSRFLRAIRLGRPMRTLFSKRRRNASSISRNMWFNFSLNPLKFLFTIETCAKRRAIFQKFNS